MYIFVIFMIKPKFQGSYMWYIQFEYKLFYDSMQNGLPFYKKKSQFHENGAYANRANYIWGTEVNASQTGTWEKSQDSSRCIYDIFLKIILVTTWPIFAAHFDQDLCCANSFAISKLSSSFKIPLKAVWVPVMPLVSSKNVFITSKKYLL